MKKNLRIASAAAAALLAVAPVAASAVSTSSVVFAATTAKVPGTIVLDRNTNTVFSVSLNDTQKASVLDQLGFAPDVAAKLDVEAATASANHPDTKGEFTQALVLTITKKDGTAFQDAHGLTLSKDNKSLTANATATARFASQQGTPTFFDKKTNQEIVNGDTINVPEDLTNGFSAKTLADLINAKYGYKTTNSAYDVANLVTSENDIESQLVNQGLKRLPNGDFDYPANGFNLKLTAKSDNGETTSITVRVNSSVNYNAPVFVVSTKDANGKVTNTLYRNGQTVAGTVAVKLNGTVDVAAIKKQVVAYIQSAKGENADGIVANEIKVNPSKVTVDASSVNTAVKGLYYVTVSATNPAGLTLQRLTY